MQAEEAVEIDGAIRAVRPWNGDARSRGVVITLAEWHDHVQAVHSAALEDRNQHLAARRSRGFDRARQESRREAEAEKRHPAVLHEDASREHGYLLWNSGEPSVSAVSCFGSVAFAIVDAVAADTSCASASAAAAVPGCTPRSLPPTSCSAKFIRLRSAPVLTHASARSA
jgi:hypothetical protein